MEKEVTVRHFYPEEFRRKTDQEKYQAKGTCEVRVQLGQVDIEVKNITYRIDHEGKVSLKPPYRVHSNKKAGIKPKLVPSIVFKDPTIWQEVEQVIRMALAKEIPIVTRNKKGWQQLDLWAPKQAELELQKKGDE